MEKVNLIVTGQLKDKSRLISSSLSFYNNPQIEEKILSTWTEEVDKNKALFIFLEKLGFKIIHEKQPLYKNRSIFYQMKSFENGLNNISNKSLRVFKSRTDLRVSSNGLKKIFNLNYQHSKNDISIFNEKIWIPFFEVSKPFYIGDECFFANYYDSLKLVNYETFYDDLDIGAGISHVRKFGNPYYEVFPELLNFLKKYSDMMFFNKNRFDLIKNYLKNENFLDYLFFYYIILQKDFRIGLNLKNQYIYFREWSNGKNQPKEVNFLNSFNEKFTFNNQAGQIFSHNETWLNSLYEEKFCEQRLEKNKLYDTYLKKLV